MAKKNTQIIQLPIAQGVDAGVDPKVSEAPILIENGVYKRRGAISKRPGQDDGAVNLSSYGSPNQIAPLRDGAVVFGGSETDVALLSNDGTSAISIDQNQAAETISVDIVRRREMTLKPVGADIMEGDNWIAFAEGGDASTAFPFVYTYRKDNGALIDSATMGGYSSTSPVFVKLSGPVYQVYSREIGNIQTRNIDSSGAFGAVGSHSTNNSSSHFFDACAIENSGGNPYAAIAYYDSTSGDVEVLFAENGVFSTTNTASITPSGTVTGGVACYPVSDTECIAVWAEDDGANTTDVFAGVYNVSGSNTVTAASIYSWDNSTDADTAPLSLSGIDLNTSGGSGDLGTVFITVKELNSATTRPQHTVAVEIKNASGTVAADSSVEHQRVAAVTKPMLTHSGASYVIGLYAESWGVTSDTNDLSAGKKFIWAAPAKLTYTTGAAASSTNLVPVGVSSISRATQFAESSGTLPGGGGASAMAALLTASRLDFSELTAPDEVSWNLGSYDISTTSTVSYANESDGYQIIAGSSPIEICGAGEVVESGFLQPPDSFVVADAGAGTIAAGTYSILLTYEYTDRDGNRHQSRPSPVAQSVTIGANRDIDVTYPTISVSKKKLSNGYFQCVAWMTDGAGGTIYRRAGSANVTGAGPLQSDNTLTLSSAPDSSDERLYTTGGALPHSETPPHTVSTAWRNRYFCFDTDERRIRYTKYRYDGEPFQHAYALALDVNSSAGDATAMASIRDRLVIFFNDEIYATDGDGFDDTGGGINYRDPYLVSQAIGCIDQRSLVRVPDGLMFESNDGIYLLSQDMRVTPIGDPVRYYVETYGPITGTAHIKGDSYVVMSTASGPALVYNWLRGQWATWSNFESRSIAAINASTQIARIDDQNDYNYLVTDVSNFDDAGSYIGLKLRTGWVSKADVGSWYRLKEFLIVGQNIGAHTLRIKIAYDHDPEWIDNITFDPASLTDFDYSAHYGDGTSDYNDNSYTLRVQGSRQKCSAFMLEVSDEEDSGGTEGWDLSAISILVQPHPTGNVKHVGTGRQVTG